MAKFEVSVLPVLISLFSIGTCWGQTASGAANVEAVGHNLSLARPNIPFSLPPTPITPLGTNSCSPPHGRNAFEVITLHLNRYALQYFETGTGLNSAGNQFSPPVLSFSNTKTVTYTDDKITYTYDEDAGTAFAGSGHISLSTSPTASNQTRFDIDLGSEWANYPTQANARQPILLKITLDDLSLKFITVSGSDPSSYAIQAGNDNDSRAMFDCRRRIDDKSVEIRVNRLPLDPKSSMPRVGSLNIGILAKDPSCATTAPACFVAPVIIDPRVPNNG